MNQVILKITGEDYSFEFDKQDFSNVCKRLGFVKNFAGKKVIATIERYSGQKSKQQLGYMFAGIVEFAAKNLHGGGYTKEEAYDLIMDNCTKRIVVNKKTGELRLFPVRLSNCNKFQTAEIIDNAITWLSYEGCMVETPEEYKKRKAELEIMKNNQSQGIIL
jgi:transcriptional regulator with PAS, ATPase and Fis domain